MVSKRLNNILSYKIAYRCCDVHIRCDLKLDIGITVAQSFKAKQDIKNLFMTYCIMFLVLVPGARDVLITLVMRGAVVGAGRRLELRGAGPVNPRTVQTSKQINHSHPILSTHSHEAGSTII